MIEPVNGLTSERGLRFSFPFLKPGSIFVEGRNNQSEHVTMTTLPVSKQALCDIFIFFAICAPLLVVHLLGEPVTLGFFCDDPSISLPYRPDTVSQAWLMVGCFGGPLLVFSITETIRAALMARQSQRMRTEIFSCVKSYAIFLFGFAVTCIFTDTIKYSVGRLRPHFLDLCKPDFGKFNCTSEHGTPRYVLDYECTNTGVSDKLMTDSRMSFPSGHASTSVYSAIFVVLYLQMRMQLKISHLLRPVLQMGILIPATLCCVSRVTDHKHFATDVLAGACLGSVLAWLVFTKLGQRLIPSSPSEKPRLPRATSIESEPQTPTPLLRPERLIIQNSYRNSTVPCSKEDFMNKV
ncbi:phospholipid phosphatase 1-like [Physella acuta]|uniref:phospholipid phosphatase 1-like n=1 Tax=Physella acuta TaxID=109671 RepID=UPI0027DD404E|nr:phospholipid phosphatase 1-like [Physella acuta]XP_059177679.1 phospholipid phosphatase 1-like [Physella acuta]XP_059177680.1 phospholipid phosphatase 1-like [Physella acuta]XP_059177681.1 phospholipid phosphatase 1-like [Physella acuta]